MINWLLDTNVLAELRRSRPDRRVAAFFETQPVESLYVSTVVFAEIRFGIDRQADAVIRSDLLTWLTHRLRPFFGERVLPLSEDVILRWRLLMEEGRKAGHTFSQPDLFLAATALHHGLTVVTRDVSQFARARVPIFNPWEGSR